MNLLFNDVELNKWIELLNFSKYSSPFQTPNFYNFFNSLENYSTDVFAVENDGNLLSLVVVTIQKETGIKAHFSRRGIIYGGPILSNENSESLSFLLNSISKYYSNKLIYLEIRNSINYKQFNAVFNESGFIYNPHLNVHLSLEGKSLDDVLNLMSYNRRREVKISLKEGSTFSLSNSVEETKHLYNILADLYTTRVKLPLPKLDYFLAFLNSEIGKVIVVKHEDYIIGGAFCITDNSSSINTLYYAGLREYNKKIFPTHIAIIGVIDYAIKNNIKIVDFMGAGKPDIPYGVRDFKMQFGGQLVEHGRYINILNPLLYKTGKLGLKVLAKIK